MHLIGDAYQSYVFNISPNKFDRVYRRRFKLHNILHRLLTYITCSPGADSQFNLKRIFIYTDSHSVWVVQISSFEEFDAFRTLLYLTFRCTIRNLDASDYAGSPKAAVGARFVWQPQGSRGGSVRMATQRQAWGLGLYTQSKEWRKKWLEAVDFELGSEEVSNIGFR